MKTQRFFTATVGMLMLSAIVVLVSRDGTALAAAPIKDTSVHTPAWSQDLPASERFELALGGAAVLDKETGLVWMKSPIGPAHTWALAAAVCIGGNIGGRLGWRLPSVPELASLVDPANSNPALPTGHPFTNVQSTNYWSATTVVVPTTSVPGPSRWVVNFSSGNVFPSTSDTDLNSIWCVRGEMNADQY